MSKILCVDDDQSILNIISVALKSAGHSVYTASNGAEAIERVIEVEPDLIITDVEMPIKSGYELVEELRKSNLTKNIPIIILSSLVKEEERVAGFESGADDYITKPFSPKELKIKVDLLLSRTAELRKLKLQQEEKLKGKIILFFGTKGGVGTTTLTINTGLSINSLGKEVCICDLNFNFGVFQFLLGIQTNRNIIHLLKESPLDLDKNLIESYLSTHKESNLKILASPAQIQTYTYEEIKKIKYVVRALKYHYDFIFIDSGCVINPLSAILISLCDHLIICSTLDLLSIYNLKMLYDFLKGGEFDFNKIKIVVNNINNYSELNIDAIKKQIHFPVIENISNDEANFIRAINKSRPYINMFPKSKSAIQIKNIAEKVIEMTKQ